MVSAEKSIIPEFRIVMGRMGVESDFHITKTEAINVRTGSKIVFSGIKTQRGDQTANLKSIAGVTTWVIEEGEDYTDEKSFDDIQRSIRASHRQNRIIWIQNPSTKEHFIYEKWIKETNKKRDVYGWKVTVSDHPDVEHIHTTYHLAEELGYLDGDWIAEAHRSRDKAVAMEQAQPGSGYNSSYYHVYIGGWLEKAEGVVFEHWQEGEFNYKLPNCIGLDWGFSDPLGMCRVAVDNKKMELYLQEVAYERQVAEPDKLLAKCNINQRELIVHDTNEPRTALSLRKLGYNLQKAKKGQIVEDIRAMHKYTIIVDPASTNLKTELNNYVWNDKKAEIPIDDYNHLIDAARYAFRRLSRKKRGVRRTN